MHDWNTYGTSLALCAMLAFSAPRAAVGEDAVGAITCRVASDSRQREYALRRVASGAAAGGWQLSMRDKENGNAWIDLRLPGAKPVITDTAAKLSYRNANGGRLVELDVSTAGSRLEVWVDHGLEVNIEPDLDPRVDTLNTEGPLTAVQCSINADAAKERE
jgi:hypothetical protein